MNIHLTDSVKGQNYLQKSHIIQDFNPQPNLSTLEFKLQTVVTLYAVTFFNKMIVSQNSL